MSVGDGRIMLVREFCNFVGERLTCAVSCVLNARSCFGKVSKLTTMMIGRLLSTMLSSQFRNIWKSFSAVLRYVILRMTSFRFSSFTDRLSTLMLPIVISCFLVVMTLSAFVKKLVSVQFSVSQLVFSICSGHRPQRVAARNRLHLISYWDFRQSRWSSLALDHSLIVHNANHSSFTVALLSFLLLFVPYNNSK